MSTKFKPFKPAAQWLAAILTIFVVLPALTPTAHAAEVSIAGAAGPAQQQQDYTCAPHKTFLGFNYGWDCHVPTYTNTLTLTTDAGNVWCNQSADGHQECKTAGTAQLRINKDALSGLTQARHFDLAMHCTTTPGQPAAQCEFAVKSRDAGSEK